MKRTGKYKYISDTLGGEELIPTVIIQFHNYPDLWMTREQYDNEGKFKGILKSLCISIKEVRQVYKPLKHPSSYPTAEWKP